MDTLAIIGALGTAIAAMATFIAWLFKDALARSDRSLQASEARCQEKDKQIERAMAANATNAKIAEDSLETTRELLGVAKATASEIGQLKAEIAGLRYELPGRPNRRGSGAGT